MKKSTILVSIIISISLCISSHAMLSRLTPYRLSKTAVFKKNQNSKNFKISHQKYYKKNNDSDRKGRQSSNNNTFKNNYKKFSFFRLIALTSLSSIFNTWWNNDKEKEINKNKIFSTEPLDEVPSYKHLELMYKKHKELFYFDDYSKTSSCPHERSDFSSDLAYLRHMIHIISSKQLYTREGHFEDKTVDEIVKAIDKEKEIVLTNKNIVLYHGMSGQHYVILDVYKRLQEKITKKTYNNFLFLRSHNTCKELSHNWETTLLQKEEDIHGDIHDTSLSLRPYLLSTNPFIFGNHTHEGESSLYYSIKSKSQIYYNRILKNIQNSLNTTTDIKSYIKPLIKTSKNHGVLLQIEVKNDDYLYLSHAYGAPIRNEKSGKIQGITVLYEEIKNKNIYEKLNFLKINTAQARLVLSKNVVEEPYGYIKSVTEYYPNPDALDYYNSKEYIQMREKVVNEIYNAMHPLEERMMEKDPRIEWQSPEFAL